MFLEVFILGGNNYEYNDLNYSLQILEKEKLNPRKVEES